MKNLSSFFKTLIIISLVINAAWLTIAVIMSVAINNFSAFFGFVDVFANIFLFVFVILILLISMKIIALIRMLYAKPSIILFLIPNAVLSLFLILNLKNGINEVNLIESLFYLLFALGSVLFTVLLWKEEIKMKKKAD